MSIVIRDVVPGDLEEVHRINQRARPAVGDITLDDIHTFARIAAYFRVAENGRRIAGFLIALTPEAPYGSVNFAWFRERYPSFIYVDRVAIREDARGQGLGRRFYDDLEAFAHGRAPMITCEVNTRPRNDESLAFHDAMGFETVGSQETEGGKKKVVMLRKPVSVPRGFDDPPRGDA